MWTSGTIRSTQIKVKRGLEMVGRRNMFRHANTEKLLCYMVSGGRMFMDEHKMGEVNDSVARSSKEHEMYTLSACICVVMAFKLDNCLLGYGTKVISASHIIMRFILIYTILYTTTILARSRRHT